MKILYDHQIYSSQVYGGISRYFYELMRCFSADSAVDFELAVRYSNNSYLRDAGFVKPETFFGGRRFSGKTTLLNFINRRCSLRSLMGSRYDVFHPTYYDPYFLPCIGNKPYVVTAYDMIHELYPNMFPSDDRTREWKKASLHNAAKIIAISESTKNDMVGFYGLDEAKVRVIHLASSLRIDSAVAIPPEFPERYLLFVGQRSGYKNFAMLVAAAAPLLKREKGLSIVCAGGGGFTPDEMALIRQAGGSGRFRQYSVGDELLVTLYKNALAFIFPSLYEGFGIPVLEAFGCGCPVVVSNRSSLPEVAGNAALYFDPDDELSLRNATEKIISDGQLRNELICKGSERFTDFSWDKTARETEAVYQSML